MDASSDAFIETMVNHYLQNFLQRICHEIHYTPTTSLQNYHIYVRDEKKEKVNKQCMARVKNNGWGRQCSRCAYGESDFCTLHKKYTDGKHAWEKYGRIDEPAPEIFVEWYAKNNIQITNRQQFYARNNPEQLSSQERQELNQAARRYC
jgi:hypothetical protein